MAKDNLTKDKRMPKRSEQQLEKDYAKVAELYCKGFTLQRIADVLNEREDNPALYQITARTVFDDLKEIRKRWEESSILDFNQRMGEEIAKIDNLERMYHDAYEKSLGPQITKKTSGYREQSDDDKEAGDAPQKILVEHSTKTSLEGNLKCLDGILKCIETRCKLLGLLTNHIDLTSGGKEIKNNNIIVLPGNGIDNDIPEFDEAKILAMIAATEKGEGASD
jgi:hypothetical protein